VMMSCSVDMTVRVDFGGGLDGCLFARGPRRRVMRVGLEVRVTVWLRRRDPNAILMICLAGWLVGWFYVSVGLECESLK